MRLTMPAKAGEVLAEVNGIAISSDDVEKALGPPLENLQEQVYSMKRQMLEVLIHEQLLLSEAAKRGVTVTALLDAEVTAKVGLVTEQDIDSVYKTHKTHLKGDEMTIRDQIRAQLQRQKLTAQRETFLNTLRSQAIVSVHLKAPRVFRATVNTDGAPFKGSATAPVTIVKFEDFHCPYCRRVQATFSEILAKYGEKVKLVHRAVTLSLNPCARQARLRSTPIDQRLTQIQDVRGNVLQEAGSRIRARLAIGVKRCLGNAAGLVDVVWRCTAESRLNRLARCCIDALELAAGSKLGAAADEKMSCDLHDPPETNNSRSTSCRNAAHIGSHESEGGGILTAPDRLRSRRQRR
jgi:hypothetical protein